MNRFKKILATSISSLSLSACGGGGGGGSAVNVISNFIEQDLTNLNGSELIISDYTNLISNFQNIISNGEYSSLSAVITGPNSEDIKKANDLLSILNQTEQLWLQTEDLINQQSDNEKYNIYNSKSYKEAYAAYLYLINDVEPIIEKVSKGKSVTLADYNKVAQKEKADEIIKTPLGEFNTMKLARHKLNSKQETYLWCAYDLDFLPVKVINTEKDDRISTAIIKSLKGLGLSTD